MIATKDAGGYHGVVISTLSLGLFTLFTIFFGFFVFLFLFFVKRGEMKLGDRQYKN